MMSKRPGHARLLFGEDEAKEAGARRLVDLINAAGDPQERQLLVDLLLRGGIFVAGPDVTRSGRDWEIAQDEGLLQRRGGERGSGRHPFVVRCGLSQIGGLSRGLVDRVVALRCEAALSDGFDFLWRAVPSECELSPLVRSGALDALADRLTRPQLLWLLWTVKRSGNRPLFAPQLPRCLGDYDPDVKRRHERTTLGLSLYVEPEEAAAGNSALLQP